MKESYRFSKEIDKYLDSDTMCMNREYNTALLLENVGITPFKDGNQWCILVGDDLQSGICGFGETIYSALVDFLKAVQCFSTDERYGPYARQYKK